MIPPGWTPEQARERLKKATPGEWQAFGRRIVEMTHRSAIAHTSDFYSSDADAAFIAHAPTDIAALLALLEEAREALARIAAQQPETLEMIRSNGFVFDSIGNEPGNWQHLAFTIYNDLCRVESLASACLSRLPAPEEPA